jgi:hypothetical protein
LTLKWEKEQGDALEEMERLGDFLYLKKIIITYCQWGGDIDISQYRLLFWVLSAIYGPCTV